VQEYRNIGLQGYRDRAIEAYIGAKECRRKEVQENRSVRVYGYMNNGVWEYSWVKKYRSICM